MTLFRKQNQDDLLQAQLRAELTQHLNRCASSFKKISKILNSSPDKSAQEVLALLGSDAAEARSVLQNLADHVNNMKPGSIDESELKSL